MECVHDQNCSIHIGDGAVQLADDIPLRQENRNCIILCEEQAAELILPTLGDRCPNLRKQPLYYLDAREQNKQISSLLPLWQAWEADGIDRNTLVINIGGGVLCDMGGFAASIFKRGIPFVNIPTTLLAMADASVGGKTAVNLDETKNVIGSFCRPEAVLIDPVFLGTLPEREFLSGMAELIKMQWIANPDFMRGGGTHDPCKNPNSYAMTDTRRHESWVKVSVNGVPAGLYRLPDDPADHRGILSWHAQLQDRLLREAGSYGYLIDAPLPLKALREGEPIVIRLEVPREIGHGLAIYGKDFGRYPVDPLLMMETK